MKKAVSWIAVFTSVCSIIVLICLISEMNNKNLSLIAFLGLLLIIIINNVLLWALFAALDRIDDLRHDVDKLKLHHKRDVFQEYEESSSDYKECKNCGYATITQDKVCPKCGLPYEEETPQDANEETVDEDSDGIMYCKKCGYQIFPEYTKCPNCQEPIDSKEDKE